MTLVVGITGGIASGKTTVANLFAKHFGIKIIDADHIAKEVLAPNTPALAQIAQHFGADILLADQNLNRVKLREIIFTSLGEKKWLDELLHPIILAQIKNKLQQINTNYVLLVVPLLIESNWQHLCDRILVVDLNEKTQISRCIQRDHINAEQAKSILQAQLSRKERLSFADDIIVNNSNLQDLIEKITNLHHKYISQAKKC